MCHCTWRRAWRHEGRARRHCLPERTWKQIYGDRSSPRPACLDDWLREPAKRRPAPTDGVTQGHLQRAAQDLTSQRAAVDWLEVGRQCAEATCDAQAALLERVRLAIAQRRASDSSAAPSR